MSWVNELVALAHEAVDEERLTLWGRGVSDLQIEEFQVGYLEEVPESLSEDSEFLAWVRRKGLCKALVFPLTNPLGEVKGFQFRVVRQGKSVYSDYFLSEEEPVYFGLAQAIPSIWETRRIFLVEGCFDLFPIQRVLPYTIATLKAGVSESLVPLLRRLVDQVWMGYDNDIVGRKHAYGFAKEHGQEFDVQVVRYPEVRLADGKKAKDPGNLWEAWGDDGLRDFLRRTMQPYVQEL
jgi:DNA primase